MASHFVARFLKLLPPNLPIFLIYIRHIHDILQLCLFPFSGPTPVLPSNRDEPNLAVTLVMIDNHRYATSYFSIFIHQRIMRPSFRVIFTQHVASDNVLIMTIMIIITIILIRVTDRATVDSIVITLTSNDQLLFALPKSSS